MNKQMDKQQLSEWRARAGRAMNLWQNEAGGTYDLLAEALENIGLAVNSTSLAQCLRPTGRRPRNFADLLQKISEILTTKLSDRRPDITSTKFRDEISSHILTGSPSPLDLELNSKTNISAGNHVLSKALFTLDLWTPGQLSETIVRKFAPSMGAAGAEIVSGLSRDAIASIGLGDFAKQNEIADEAIELGEASPGTPLMGEGLYLKGEALRLMADFEPERMKAKQLRTDAIELYGRAEIALGGDPRPIRGRARTIEVLGDLDGAMEIFEQSNLSIESRQSNADELDHLSIAHERIRTLRHKINCLAAMHAEAPLATNEAQRRGDEIRRLIASSEPEHKAVLPLFEQHRDWWLIEWFMAQVLHAKAWTVINEPAAAMKRLEWSLKLRLDMISEVGKLNSVELGNLNWWIGVARGVHGSWESEQSRALEAFIDSLNRGDDRSAIKLNGKKFLEVGSAPWSFQN